MRKLLRNAIASLGVAFAAGGAQAAFIDFIEGATELDPVSVFTNIVLTAPVAVTPESALVLGFHHPGISPSPIAVPPGMRAAALFEPGNPNLVSDYVLLTASEIRDDPVFGVAQDLRIEFFSRDILLPDLLADLIPRGFVFGGGPVEDGTLQDLSEFLGTLPEGLIVRALSLPGEVPEPAPLALLGLAAVASLLVRRRHAAG